MNWYLWNPVISVSAFITILVWISTDWIGVGTLVIGTMIGPMALELVYEVTWNGGYFSAYHDVHFARELDAFGFA